MEHFVNAVAHGTTSVEVMRVLYVIIFFFFVRLDQIALLRQHRHCHMYRSEAVPVLSGLQERRRKLKAKLNMCVQVTNETLGNDVLVDQNQVLTIKHQLVFIDGDTSPELINVNRDLAANLGN